MKIFPFRNLKKISPKELNKYNLKIGIVLFILGILILFSSIKTLRYLAISAHYPSTLGKIAALQKRNFSVNMPGQGTTFSGLTILKYEYTVNNRAYSSTKVSIGAPELSIKDYLVGQEVRVYFNPDNPKDAFLKFPPDNYKSAMLGLMLVGIIILGFGFKLFFIFKREENLSLT
jgi:hypothetical protein